MRAKRVLPAVLIVAASSWMMAALWSAYILVRHSDDDLNQAALRSGKSHGEFALAEILPEKAALELSVPETALPDAARYDRAVMARLFKEAETCKFTSSVAGLPPALQKYRKLHLHLCKQETLSPDFFENPPYISPLGGSFAAAAYNSGNESFHNPEWLNKNKKFFHVLEFNVLPDLQNSPAAIKELMDKKPMVRVGESVLLSNGRGGYSLFKNSENQPDLRKRHLEISLSAIPLLILIVLVLLWQRYSTRIKNRKDREMVMHTLAHEIRHPATSLQLSLEAFRGHFDELPDEVKMEFLRMCDQVQRLHRVIGASKQYLRADEDKPFSFNLTRVESINSYLAEVVEPYREKIEFTTLAKDRDWKVDHYWLSVCVVNLIKNALIHGAKPVRVVASESKGFVSIAVSDQGAVSELTLNEMTKPFSQRQQSPGLGLGLSLVERLVSLMGGELRYSSSPTTFTIVLRDS